MKVLFRTEFWKKDQLILKERYSIKRHIPVLKIQNFILSTLLLANIILRYGGLKKIRKIESKINSQLMLVIDSNEILNREIGVET
jgi:hypothetical protein